MYDVLDVLNKRRLSVKAVSGGTARWCCGASAIRLLTFAIGALLRCRLLSTWPFLRNSLCVGHLLFLAAVIGATFEIRVANLKWCEGTKGCLQAALLERGRYSKIEHFIRR